MTSGKDPGERPLEERVLRSLLPAGLIGLAVCLALLLAGATTGFEDAAQWRLAAAMNLVLAVVLTIVGIRARQSR